jgi:phage shock protein PspC (stress-responsive transcriptional regulator)
MKGTVLDFSIPTSEGVISGDDGGRYTFSGSEWRSRDYPSPQMQVDFVPEAGSAKAIYTVIADPAGDHHELYRSSDQRVIAGVCAGLAHRWGTSILGVRLIYFFATMFLWVFLLPLYIFLWLLLPRRPTKPSRADIRTVARAT